MLPKLTIRDGLLHFADLVLEREPVTHRLLFAPAPLVAMCRANNLDPAEILADEDLSMWLVCEWYLVHRLAGGDPDAVVEAIGGEVTALQDSGIAALQPGSGIPS